MRSRDGGQDPGPAALRLDLPPDPPARHGGAHRPGLPAPPTRTAGERADRGSRRLPALVAGEPEPAHAGAPAGDAGGADRAVRGGDPALRGELRLLHPASVGGPVAVRRAAEFQRDPLPGDGAVQHRLLPRADGGRSPDDGVLRAGAGGVSGERPGADLPGPHPRGGTGEEGGGTRQAPPEEGVKGPPGASV